MTLVLFTLGMLGVILLHAHKISKYVKENMELTVFLKADASEVDIMKVTQVLIRSEAVKSYQFIDKDEAARKLKEELGEDFVKFLGYNPLLPSIDVRLKAEFADNEHIEKLKSSLQDEKPVKEVSYQQSLVEQVNRNLGLIGAVILGFSGLLFIISLALINNTIRLSLYARRMLIRSMQLVGATQGFIRKPFILKGFLNGLYGAIIANLLLIGLLYFAQSRIPELFSLQDLQLMLTLMGSVIVLGILISVSSTFFAVNKYLRKKAGDLY
jgi:cell division transport system permease protein